MTRRPSPPTPTRTEEQAATEQARLEREAATAETQAAQLRAETQK